jgi:integrase
MTIRKQYPPIRTYDKSGQTYYRVDLRGKHYSGTVKTKQFTDRAEAEKFAEDWAANILKKGFDSVQAVNSPRLIELEKQCALFGYTPEDAVKVACNVWFEEKAIKLSPLMSELLDKWVQDRETGIKKIREASKKAIKNYAGLFKQYFGALRIKEVTIEKVEAYLKSREMSQQTKKNNLRYLQNFFNWANHRNYYQGINVAKYWLKEIVIERRTAEYYTVNECEQILREAMRPENQRIVSYFALGLFAGIRPDETEQLTWANILWDTREIYIPSHISKTKADRQFVMSETLFAWLTLVKNVQPLIPNKNIRRIKDAVTKDLDFVFTDGLRHTFATFHYAKYNNYETLKSIMGNSPNIIQKHYKGVVSVDQIEAFFRLTPQWIKEHDPKEKIARYKKLLAEKEAAEKLKLPEGAAKKRVSKYLEEIKQIPVAEK